ncbi:hypothetical protein Acr_26g0004200 [Actinidia rufa]|uniref:Uncharacterized protein n=1 Tax=Actinidia rufa TaxID=165716 RepID=A0A7J0H225_9ERIC|nr:hypothetical protein Acr_26g0004200 [Actinidia rufa]
MRPEIQRGWSPRHNSERSSRAMFWRTHSSGSMVNSFSPSITTTTCLGDSDELGESRGIKSCANDNLLPVVDSVSTAWPHCFFLCDHRSNHFLFKVERDWR